MRKRREIEQPSHHFRDIGEPIGDADYQPRISGNPEQTLAAAFTSMKRDYGGPLHAAPINSIAATVANALAGRLCGRACVGGDVREPPG